MSYDYSVHDLVSVVQTLYCCHNAFRLVKCETSNTSTHIWCVLTMYNYSHLRLFVSLFYSYLSLDESGESELSSVYPSGDETTEAGGNDSPGLDFPITVTTVSSNSSQFGETTEENNQTSLPDVTGSDDATLSFTDLTSLASTAEPVYTSESSVEHFTTDFFRSDGDLESSTTERLTNSDATTIHRTVPLESSPFTEANTPRATEESSISENHTTEDMDETTDQETTESIDENTTNISNIPLEENATAHDNTSNTLVPSITTSFDPSTRSSTGPSTEPSTEPSTKLPTKQSSASTGPPSDSLTKPSTEHPLESSTERPTASTEPPSDSLTKPSTEQSLESSTEPPTASTEPPSDLSTKPSTEPPPKSSSEPPSESSTESSAESSSLAEVNYRTTSRSTTEDEATTLRTISTRMPPTNCK